MLYEGYLLLLLSLIVYSKPLESYQDNHSNQEAVEETASTATAEQQSDPTEAVVEEAREDEQTGERIGRGEGQSNEGNDESSSETQNEERQEQEQHGEERREEGEGTREEATEGTEEATTEQTFPATERLDSPIERIEIRLIDDDNATNTQEETQQVAPSTEETTNEVEPTEFTQNDHVLPPTESTPPTTPLHVEEEQEAPQEGASNYQEKYKKANRIPLQVEYAVAEPETTPHSGTNEGQAEEGTTVHPRRSDNVMRDDTAPFDDGTTPEVEEEAKKRLQMAAMMAESGRSRMPMSAADDVKDEDLPVFNNNNNEENPDEEVEPVEECLANRALLSQDVVEKMQEKAEKLSKLIRKLNKQQKEYCQERKDQENNDNYFTDLNTRCPLWREEKIVHYYKLMRITYCADYSKWPNAPKLQKTYGQYLPFFETLYAFQKQ